MDLKIAFEVFAIAVALAMDAFAVSCGVGLVLEKPSRRQTFRLSWHFGLFQFLMPLIGWFIGSGISGIVSGFGRWIGFGVLLAIGFKMTIEGIKGLPASFTKDPTKGSSLVLLSLAVSIDALAVGFSLSVLGVGVLWPSIVIGIVAGSFTLFGLFLGNALSRRYERLALIFGGLILIGIGVKSLF